MDVLGYRLKLAVVMADTDSAVVPETAPFNPPGTSLQYSDFATDGASIGDDGWRAMPPRAMDSLVDAIARARRRIPGVIGVFADTLALVTSESLNPVLDAAGDVTLVTPADALRAAGEATGWTRAVGLLTPFGLEDNVVARQTLVEAGFDVVADVALDCPNRTAPAEISFVALRDAHRRLIDAGARHVVQLGHGLPYAKLTSNLEEDFGRPILAINRVMLWRMLRRGFIHDLVTHGGRLLLEY